MSMLSSCVAPYDSYGPTSVTTTYYQPGYRIDSLPGGYRSELITGNNYYYHNGVYYRRHSNGYVVVDAPRTSRYYTEYDRHRGGDRHRISDNYRDQRRDSVRVIPSLPAGYRIVNHGGNQYYQSGENYYRRDANGYVVVQSPY